MKVTKCDICGSQYDDRTKVKIVQIRKVKDWMDTRPILEKSYDVCTNCINDIFEGGTLCEKTKEAADGQDQDACNV